MDVGGRVDCGEGRTLSGTHTLGRMFDGPVKSDSGTTSRISLKQKYAKKILASVNVSRERREK